VGDAARTFPRHVVAHADWVFGRWMRNCMERGLSVTAACHFNGAATLVTIKSPENVTSEGGGIDNDAAAVELSPFKIVGCTLNPDALVNEARLTALVHAICSDPAVEVVSMERMDDAFILGDTPRWREAKRLQDSTNNYPDRIGGGCQYLFERIHPLLAHDMRIKAATALLAHHLIFTAGGHGRTCRERFGDIAAYLRVRR
jgi:hypothetical protein